MLFEKKRSVAKDITWLAARSRSILRPQVGPISGFQFRPRRRLLACVWHIAEQVT